MNSLTVTLPLPPKALMANASRGWKGRHYAKKKYKATAYALIREAAGIAQPRWPKATVDMVWRARRPQYRPDEDNAWAAMKYAFDQFEAVGVIETDEKLSLGEYDFKVGEPGVVLTVTKGEA